MNCLRTRDLLSGYLDNELDVRTKSSVREHLSSCGSCRSELETLRLIIQEAASLPLAEPPAELRARILSAVSDRSASAGMFQRLQGLFSARTVPWAAGVSASIAAALLLIVTTSEKPDSFRNVSRAVPATVRAVGAVASVRSAGNASPAAPAKNRGNNLTPAAMPAQMPALEYAALPPTPDNIFDNEGAAELPEVPTDAQPQHVLVETRLEEPPAKQTEEVEIPTQAQPTPEPQAEHKVSAQVKAGSFEHMALFAPAVSEDNSEWIRTMRLQARSVRQDYP